MLIGVAAAMSRIGVRQTELLAVLSLGADLGLGQPLEHVLRECLIARRLAEHAGLDAAARGVVCHTALLTWVGCHVDAYEQAKWFGDDLAFKSDYVSVDGPGMGFVLRHLGAGRPMLDRALLGVSLLAGGRREVDQIIDNHRRAAESLAAALGLAPSVRDSLGQAFERWDGKGTPGNARGDQISVASRLVSLADVVEVFHRLGGVPAAIEVARKRSGTQFDPAIVDLFCAHADEVLDGVDASTTWDAVVEQEPDLDVVLRGAELDAALRALANFVDVKSPYTVGHSAAVADLAEAAARVYGLAEAEVVMVRRAGLVHDLGRLGVPNTIWDKKSMLTLVEMERVRMHPYLTERMLASSSLAPIGAVAAQHHERLDGSGYPRGLRGSALAPPGRILAAADAYQSKLEPRPYRPELAAAGAVDHLRAEVTAGRLDARAVDAVLRCAGHRPGRRSTWPAGLTNREVEVLRLAARGLSSHEIAARLGIARKTAANHVEHIYAKIGATNRALASLYAAQHGLVTDDLGATTD